LTRLIRLITYRAAAAPVETEAAEPHDPGAGSLLHVLPFRAATQRVSDLKAYAFPGVLQFFATF
jgi:hypothetical protein